VSPTGLTGLPSGARQSSVPFAWIPRCALEIYNSGQVHIEKIFKD